jgi:hypothetical protein
VCLWGALLAVVPIHLAQTDESWLRPPGGGNMTTDLPPGYSRNGTPPNVTVLFENPFTSVSMNRIPQTGGDILWCAHPMPPRPLTTLHALLTSNEIQPQLHIRFMVALCR